MFSPWQSSTPGLLALPSGRLVRGRALRRALPVVAPGGLEPEFGLYATFGPPPAMGWENRWLRWPDFWLPLDHAAARAAILEAWQSAGHRRVEVACGGGQGRTGTILACLAVLDGVPAADAVDFVRANYAPRAVEMPWQRRYVRTFAP